MDLFVNMGPGEYTKPGNSDICTMSRIWCPLYEGMAGTCGEETIRRTAGGCRRRGLRTWRMSFED